MLFVWRQLLCLIGEAFEEMGDEVNGAVINLRAKGDKLGLWTADASHSDSVVRIGYTAPPSSLLFTSCNELSAVKLKLVLTIRTTWHIS